MFLPKFSGNDNDNPKSWIIFRAELYFTYLDWLPLPLFYLDGEALSWFDWFFRNKLFFDWNHFKDTFTRRFQQQINIDVLGRLANSSQVHLAYISSVPIVSQSTVMSPCSATSHFPKSSAMASTCDTGSSQADQMFDKLPVKFQRVESVALIAKTTTDVEPVEDIEIPQIGNIYSTEANLANEPSPIFEDQVFHKIPHTTVSSNTLDMKAIVHNFEHSVSTAANVCNGSLCKETKVSLLALHDTDMANNDEGENSRDKVTLFKQFCPLNTFGFLVAFACQGSILDEIDYSFVVALWLLTIPYWHKAFEEYCGDNPNRAMLCLEFRICKCNWVDTGQECSLSGVLLSDICAYKNYILDFSIGGVTWLVPIMSPQNQMGSFRALPHSTSDVLDKFSSENEIFIATSDTHSVEVLLNAEHETPTGGCDTLNLSEFPFDPSAEFFTVPIYLTAMNPCVRNLRVSFMFMALMGYTVNVEAVQLQGCSGKFRLIAFSNSMTRVWDPGQTWCANFSILQSDLALAVASSPNFTHFYIVKRGLSVYLTTWRRNIFVFLLAWHAENKARYVDMRILETCLLKVNVFASLGMLLLWKDNSGLVPVAKYLRLFQSASIMLILAYVHHCKSEGLDSTKPLISRLTFLISSQLVFSVDLGERNCTTYCIQAVVVLNMGVGSFDIRTGNDMPTRNSTDVKILVSLIVFRTAGICSLFIHKYTTLPFHEEILSANLAFSTTLGICYTMNLHNTFVVMHSLRSWIKHLTMIFNQCSGLENTTEHMWLHLSYGVVITLPFNGIDAKQYVSYYESDILLLLSLLYLNLEDKVLIEEGSIVVNTDSLEAGQAIGLGAKPRRGSRIRQPNSRFTWDPG